MNQIANDTPALPTTIQVDVVMHLVGKQPWLYNADAALIDADALRGCLIRGETVQIRYRCESPVWAETSDHAAITIHRRPHNGSRVTVELMYAGGKSSDIAQVVGLYQAVTAIAAVIEAVLA